MAKIKTTALLLALCLAACVGTTPKQAAEYNDMLIKHQKNIIIKYDSLLESFDTYVARKMERSMISLMQELDNAKYHITNCEPVKGGEDFRLALLNYIDTYMEVSRNEIPVLIEIYSLPQNEFTPENKSKWDNTYMEMDSKLKTAYKALKEAQEKYAGKFNLKISQ